MQFAKWMNHIKQLGCLVLFGLPFAAAAQTTVNVLAEAPQFGIYGSTLPTNYTPPQGVIVLRGNQSWYTLTKLTASQQQQDRKSVV